MVPNKNSDYLKNKRFYVVCVLTLFCIIGIIVKLSLSQKTGNSAQGPATASIWGYGLVSICILTLIFVNIGALVDTSVDIGKLNDKGPNINVFQGGIPSILILGVLMWLITLNLIYFKRINEGEVASEYNMYSFISTILVILQLAVTIKYLYDSLKKDNDTAKKFIGASLILTLFNFVRRALILIDLVY